MLASTALSNSAEPLNTVEGARETDCSRRIPSALVLNEEPTSPQPCVQRGTGHQVAILQQTILSRLDQAVSAPRCAATAACGVFGPPNPAERRAETSGRIAALLGEAAC